MTDQLPIAIRSHKPDTRAYRVTGTRPDGLPDGVHTGGVWITPDGEAWKPLDGRPHMNAGYHLPTLEDECLWQMKDVPLFPKNWRIEKRNGRRWLVRKKAKICGIDWDWTDNDLEFVLLVEQSVRELNRRGWELNDPISLGYIDGEYFIVDLSSAHHTKSTASGAWLPDDESRIYKFFELCGYDKLVARRRLAKSSLHEWHMTAFTDEDIDEYRRRKEYQHVYASYNRPMSNLWASLDGVEYVHEERADWARQIPWTWVMAKDMLPDDKCRSYELTWCWSPVQYDNKGKEQTND